VSPPDEWNTLERAIRDGTIPRDDARKDIVRLDGSLREGRKGKVVRSPFHFPVKRYGPDSIGGKHGSGFKPEGYDFYDGNRHGGHPAHDLFIRDTRGDGLDTGTGKPAEIVSFTDGVVIAVNPSWQHPSEIRGGVYIWIYDSTADRYYYYAHLAQALVAPGDRVRAGDTIALLGRTGKNAWSKRSPTHLHFMCLSFDEGRMVPHDTYRELLGSVTR
jgi:murein DD-endopeptidase MepM/ murein hydrolase activator NlpD